MLSEPLLLPPDPTVAAGPFESANPVVAALDAAEADCIRAPSTDLLVGATTASCGFYSAERSGWRSKRDTQTRASVAVASKGKSVRRASSDESASATSNESALDISFDISVASAYRRAGVSRSDDPTVQGVLDLEFADGWSGGVFTSTADSKHANFEVTFFGAKEFEFGDTELTIGATAIVDVDRQRLDFGIAQASVSHPIGPFDVTLAVNYAWEQSHLDDEDNVYVVARGKSLIGSAFGIPLTLGVSAGRMEGRLAIADVRLDWSTSLTADIDGMDIALSYVDNDLDGERGKAAWIVSITRTF